MKKTRIYLMCQVGDSQDARLPFHAVDIPNEYLEEVTGILKHQMNVTKANTMLTDEERAELDGELGEMQYLINALEDYVHQGNKRKLTESEIKEFLYKVERLLKFVRNELEFVNEKEERVPISISGHPVTGRPVIKVPKEEPKLSIHDLPTANEVFITETKQAITGLQQIVERLVNTFEVSDQLRVDEQVETNKRFEDQHTRIQQLMAGMMQLGTSEAAQSVDETFTQHINRRMADIEKALVDLAQFEGILDMTKEDQVKEIGAKLVNLDLRFGSVWKTIEDLQKFKESQIAVNVLQEKQIQELDTKMNAAWETINKLNQEHATVVDYAGRALQIERELVRMAKVEKAEEDARNSTNLRLGVLDDRFKVMAPLIKRVGKLEEETGTLSEISNLANQLKGKQIVEGPQSETMHEMVQDLARRIGKLIGGLEHKVEAIEEGQKLNSLLAARVHDLSKQTDIRFGENHADIENIQRSAMALAAEVRRHKKFGDHIKTHRDQMQSIETRLETVTGRITHTKPNKQKLPEGSGMAKSIFKPPASTHDFSEGDQCRNCGAYTKSKEGLGICKHAIAEEPKHTWKVGEGICELCGVDMATAASINPCAGASEEEKLVSIDEHGHAWDDGSRCYNCGTYRTEKEANEKCFNEIKLNVSAQGLINAEEARAAAEDKEGLGKTNGERGLIHEWNRHNRCVNCGIEKKDPRINTGCPIVIERDSERVSLAHDLDPLGVCLNCGFEPASPDWTALCFFKSPENAKRLGKGHIWKYGKCQLCKCLWRSEAGIHQCLATVVVIDEAANLPRTVGGPGERVTEACVRDIKGHVPNERGVCYYCGVEIHDENDKRCTAQRAVIHNSNHYRHSWIRGACQYCGIKWNMREAKTQCTLGHLWVDGLCLRCGCLDIGRMATVVCKCIAKEGENRQGTGHIFINGACVYCNWRKYSCDEMNCPQIDEIIKNEIQYRHDYNKGKCSHCNCDWGDVDSKKFCSLGHNWLGNLCARCLVPPNSELAHMYCPGSLKSKDDESIHMEEEEEVVEKEFVIPEADEKGHRWIEHTCVLCGEYQLMDSDMQLDCPNAGGEPIFIDEYGHEWQGSKCVRCGVYRYAGTAPNSNCPKRPESEIPETEAIQKANEEEGQARDGWGHARDEQGNCVYCKEGNEHQPHWCEALEAIALSVKYLHHTWLKGVCISCEGVWRSKEGDASCQGPPTEQDFEKAKEKTPHTSHHWFKKQCMACWIWEHSEKAFEVCIRANEELNLSHKWDKPTRGVCTCEMCGKEATEAAKAQPGGLGSCPGPPHKAEHPIKDSSTIKLGHRWHKGRCEACAEEQTADTTSQPCEQSGLRLGIAHEWVKRLGNLFQCERCGLKAHNEGEKHGGPICPGPRHSQVWETKKELSFELNVAHVWALSGDVVICVYCGKIKRKDEALKADTDFCPIPNLDITIETEAEEHVWEKFGTNAYKCAKCGLNISANSDRQGIPHCVGERLAAIANKLFEETTKPLRELGHRWVSGKCLACGEICKSHEQEFTICEKCEVVLELEHGWFEMPGGNNLFRCQLCGWELIGNPIQCKQPPCGGPEFSKVKLLGAELAASIKDIKDPWGHDFERDQCTRCGLWAGSTEAESICVELVELPPENLTHQLDAVGVCMFCGLDKASTELEPHCFFFILKNKGQLGEGHDWKYGRCRICGCWHRNVESSEVCSDESKTISEVAQEHIDAVCTGGHRWYLGKCVACDCSKDSKEASDICTQVNTELELRHSPMGVEGTRQRRCAMCGREWGRSREAFYMAEPCPGPSRSLISGKPWIQPSSDYVKRTRAKAKAQFAMAAEKEYSEKFSDEITVLTPENEEVDKGEEFEGHRWYDNRCLACEMEFGENVRNTDCSRAAEELVLQHQWEKWKDDTEFCVICDRAIPNKVGRHAAGKCSGPKHEDERTNRLQAVIPENAAVKYEGHHWDDGVCLACNVGVLSDFALQSCLEWEKEIIIGGGPYSKEQTMDLRKLYETRRKESMKNGGHRWYKGECVACGCGLHSETAFAECGKIDEALEMDHVWVDLGDSKTAKCEICGVILMENVGICKGPPWFTKTQTFALLEEREDQPLERGHRWHKDKCVACNTEVDDMNSDVCSRGGEVIEIEHVWEVLTAIRCQCMMCGLITTRGGDVAVLSLKNKWCPGPKHDDPVFTPEIKNEHNWERLPGNRSECKVCGLRVTLVKNAVQMTAEQRECPGRGGDGDTAEGQVSSGAKDAEARGGKDDPSGSSEVI